MRLIPQNWCRSYDASLAKRIEAARRQQAMKEFYGRFLHPGDLCFDVGANEGNRTAIFLALGARVVCIEPQPLCLKKLRKRLGRMPDVTIVAKALGEKEGQS